MNMTVDYGGSYVTRFMIHKGTVRIFVNETPIYASNDTYPVGEYHAPHLAVRFALARFRYVKVYATD